MRLQDDLLQRVRGQLCSIVWRLMSDPDIWRLVYTSFLVIHVRVIQEVDSNNLIIL